MLVNIRQPFLDNAEKGGFQVVVEPPEISRDLDLDLEPGSLVETLGITLQRARKAGFVEQRRMQQTGDGSNLREAGSRQLAGLGESLSLAFRFQPWFLQTAEIYAQGGQELRGAVVQLPRDPPSLVILCAQQVSGEVMQPLIEIGRASCR